MSNAPRCLPAGGVDEGKGHRPPVPPRHRQRIVQRSPGLRYTFCAQSASRNLLTLAPPFEGTIKRATITLRPCTSEKLRQYPPETTVAAVPLISGGRITRIQGQLPALPLPPIHLSGTGQNHPPETGQTRTFRDVVDPEQIVRQKLGEEIRVVRCRGKMHEDLDPAWRDPRPRGPLGILDEVRETYAGARSNPPEQRVASDQLCDNRRPILRKIR